MNDMTNTANLADLVKEIKAASENISKADEQNNKLIEELKKNQGLSDGKIVKIGDELAMMVSKATVLEQSVNDLMKRNGRPGGEGPMTKQEEHEREQAIQFLKDQHEEKTKKKDPQNPFKANEDQIAGAITYNKALRAMMGTLDHNTIPEEYRKSLSAFSFGTNSFVMVPEMSNIIIRCIVDPTDLSGLFDSMSISAPSVRFLIDNARMFLAGWACEASCFANNPQPDLSEGLGTLEIKPETIRFVLCVTRDLLEDASTNIEQWILRRVSEGIRATINASILLGDGVGKPLGVLTPAAGIPICDVSPTTPNGQFTWQDLVMLKYEIPMQWHEGLTWLMNQRTYSLLSTMSSPDGRPLFGAYGAIPGGLPMQFAGSPIQIVSQMPDVAPGSTPIAIGNWKRVYMIVWRKQITMQTDPYSAGFCVLYRFEARCGGGVICPNAARLLRIR